MPVDVPNDIQGQVLGALAHDLRSPITSIYMWIEILERKNDETTLARGLDVIARSARAQARLLEEALELSSALADSLPLENAPLDLAALIDDEVASLSQRPDLTGTISSLGRAVERVEVVGDAQKLRQLTRWLVGSANRVASRLDLWLSTTDDTVELRISDLSSASAESHLPHLFETLSPQQQAVKPLKSSALRLMASQRIAALHGGWIGPLEPVAGHPGAAIGVRLPR